MLTPVDQRRHGSVTERLSARLDEIDPVIGRMLKNEAKLIADALTTAGDVEYALKLARDGWDLLREHERRIDGHSMFVGASFWQRLRWLVTGK